MIIIWIFVSNLDSRRRITILWIRLTVRHGLAEFLDAVNQIKVYGFDICTHVILNLPNDTIRDAVETAKILSAMRIIMENIFTLPKTLYCVKLMKMVQ